ncbi:hypothetical protein DUI87_35361 [Hirundo rustica rustica]|uniref:Uncharacterized protein n=1 Tax=Hirundo rustica rustica TaxID=333673 RepID=A0A3M0IP98_HIRRU|nr:hypothetical protein DUI87_35361 [Hirundo rustica rustica]
MSPPLWRCPPPLSAALARALPAELEPLARELRGIAAASVAVVNLQYEGAALPVTVMLGGAWFRQTLGDPAAVAPELLLRRARAAVRDHLGLAGTPRPRHGQGAAERIQRFLEEQQLPLSLIGASYSGVSVNDCIAGAEAAVGRILGSLPEP